MRGDLADIRLAEYVFAPHYAAPLAMQVSTEVSLRAAPEPDADILMMLQPGDIFEALDLTATQVWGSAPAHGLAGYVDRAALGPADPSA